MRPITVALLSLLFAFAAQAAAPLVSMPEVERFSVINSESAMRNLTPKANALLAKVVARYNSRYPAKASASQWTKINDVIKKTVDAKNDAAVTTFDMKEACAFELSIYNWASLVYYNATSKAIRNANQRRALLTMLVNAYNVANDMATVSSCAAWLDNLGGTMAGLSSVASFATASNDFYNFTKEVYQIIATKKVVTDASALVIPDVNCHNIGAVIHNSLNYWSFEMPEYIEPGDPFEDLARQTVDEGNKVKAQTNNTVETFKSSLTEYLKYSGNAERKSLLIASERFLETLTDLVIDND